MPDDGRTIRGLVVDGAGPTVVWLGGFRSDMTGAKAEAVAAWGRSRDRKVVRFDYSGHGGSDGAFEDGRIGGWFDEAKAVIAAEAGPEFIVVGSSMGGWMALLLAREHLPGLKGAVLVAPAPDFTEKLFYPALPADVRACVALCLADGWSHAEAAQALGLPLGTVKSHVSRGRARLLVALGGSDDA